ncbi:MAG: glycosyltransferase [Candidatus Shapirobacteria bacterium]|jgi:cellulose synthase/poly-beta-1,6-N-acetylglucosamine synthase-like glycosyltransferase
MTKPLFSIIIPVRHETPHLRETRSFLKLQTFKSFELLVITDSVASKYLSDTHHQGPSFKRNLGAKLAAGQYLAFLDDDSYPSADWLFHAKKIFDLFPQAGAVCGPCLTPPKDGLFQQASGLFWSSFLGSGGAGSYRNSIKPARYVDDFPSVNLIVKKSLFNKIGGFDTRRWPGEDTLLCLQITKDHHQKIIYHPALVVYHHRRPVLLPHLQQSVRYAQSRADYAKRFPQTSLRLGYLLPSVFAVGLAILPFLHFSYLLLYPYLFYVLILLLTFFSFLFQGNNLVLSLVATVVIPITHLAYGLFFIWGILKTNFIFKPHKINVKNGQYIGG